MRVVVIGSEGDRVRLRSPLEAAGIEVIGEAPTIAAARAARFAADALVVVIEHDRDSVFAEHVIEPLTTREMEVLELLAEGLPNKLIAARLGIGDQTVKFHVSAICGKLGATNRTDAVRRAVRQGLITL